MTRDAPHPTPDANALGSVERPLRVAVVGAGPAGFYTVDALVKHKQIHAEVDLFERLPCPYGLVRYGVAPDHQKIKSVTAAYDKLGDDPRVRFFGNVHVGSADVSVEELAARYDQIVFAVGCETDKRLGIPGEDLVGNYAATSFVGWYNGHPDFRDFPVDLGAERVAIVGVGDVAMDLTRMLMTDTATLGKTDITDYALSVFGSSKVREIVILGRRGPAQAAFATKELEDIVEISDLHVHVDANHVAADIESGQVHDGLARRKLDYLLELAKREPGPATRHVKLRFLTSPVEITGTEGRVTGVRVEQNELFTDGKGGVSARGTGRFDTIPVGLVFRSVGYRGVKIPGLPFDERQGVVPNTDGRVLREGVPWPNVYVAGWIKRGPSGVIGTNKSDAAATVQKMAEDIVGQAGRPAPETSREAIDTLLRARAVATVSFQDWKRLDRIERDRGVARGKIRDKLTRVVDMLAAIGPDTPR